MGIWEWAKAHPEQAWFVASAILTALFAPKTPEQLQAMPTWLASVFQLTASFGVDVPKLVSLFRTGPKSVPPGSSMAPPPMPPPGKDEPK
jgi:hypothetical protein